MGALLHFEHSEGKRISLHHRVTDLMSTGRLSLLSSLADQGKLGQSESSVVVALLYLSPRFTLMR